MYNVSGDAPPIEADEQFSETYQSLIELLSQQAVVYEQEDHALRVLMAEEVQEKMTREQAEREKGWLYYLKVMFINLYII